MANRRVAFKKRRQNRLGMICVSVVVMMIFVVLLFSMSSLKTKRDTYVKKEEALNQQIENEEKRAQDLIDYEKYTKTAAYVEEVAKEKLGLVYADEIVFQAEDSK